MSIRLKALLLAGPVTILALLIITSLVGAGSLLWVAAGSPPDPAHDFALLWIFRGALRPLLVLAAIMGTLAVGRIAYALVVQRHPETWWRGSRRRRERDRLALARAVGCGVAVLELGALPRATQERLRAMPGTRIV